MGIFNIFTEIWQNGITGKLMLIIGVILLVLIVVFIIKLIKPKKKNAYLELSSEERNADFIVYEKQMVHQDGSMYITSNGKPTSEIEDIIFVLVLQNPYITKEKDLYEIIVDIDTYKRFYQKDAVIVTMRGKEVISIKRNKEYNNPNRNYLEIDE